MNVLFKQPPPTINSLKYEIESLSDRIESLRESLLSLMFSKRAKLFLLRDEEVNVYEALYYLDLEIQRIQKLL